MLVGKTVGIVRRDLLPNHWLAVMGLEWSGQAQAGGSRVIVLQNMGQTISGEFGGKVRSVSQEITIFQSSIKLILP